MGKIFFVTGPILLRKRLVFVKPAIKNGWKQLRHMIIMVVEMTMGGCQPDPSSKKAAHLRLTKDLQTHLVIQVKTFISFCNC